MLIEQTLGIIKPDAVAKQLIGTILQRIEQQGGLRLIGIKLLQLTANQAEQFYAMHRSRSFFSELVTFMTSGVILPFVLEGENAIVAYRLLMGATHPKEAAAGTIRADFAESIERNAVHGSDSDRAAEREITFFFDKTELFGSQTHSI